jgi:hypothetical protein
MCDAYGPATCGLYQEPFNSRLDCQFGQENGEAIAAVIGVFTFIGIVMICCCIARCDVWSDESCMFSSPPPVISKPPRPAYTPDETAIPTMAFPVDAREVMDRPELLRVCSILATDVVLVASAPVEEPITVISAESEIVFSLPYDIYVVPRVTIKPAAVEKVM